LAILFPLWIATAQAQTLHVSPVGTDSNDGLSWTHALKSLSAALTKAIVNDQVWAAAGTYTENVCVLAGGVSIYGGFAGNESTLSQRVFKSNKTQINGSILLSTPFSDPPSAVDGFTVQNPAGSGISCLGNGRIANNTLLTCAGGSTGGGLFLRQGAPVVLNNLIYGNTGNGVYSNGLMPNTRAAGNLIFNNSASGWRDVGSQRVVFINNTIAGNGAGNGTLNPGIYAVSRLTFSW
jgi:hypothetical protein